MKFEFKNGELSLDLSFSFEQLVYANAMAASAAVYDLGQEEVRLVDKFVIVHNELYAHVPTTSKRNEYWHGYDASVRTWMKNEKPEDEE